MMLAMGRFAALLLVFLPYSQALAELKAGAAKVDITREDAGPVNGRLYARAVVLSDGQQTTAMIAVDAVAIGEIGPIDNQYLGKVRDQLQQRLQISPERVIVNASHCHGIVCRDVAERTVQAVAEAKANLTPVRIGVGVGREDRIQENRRMKLKAGGEADVRHAYSLPPDAEVESTGPIDPEIGVVRIDRLDGSPLAVIYNFAMHPIQGSPGGENTSDITGFASLVMEETLGHDCVALFVQGCAGDINPAFYKAVDAPRDAEPYGNMLALSTLKAHRRITTKPDASLKVERQLLRLPRANYAARIQQLEAERERLVASLRGVTLNLKRFLPLMVKYGLGGDFPSYDAHRYLHEQNQKRELLKQLDADNRRHLQAYLRNIYTMERITRLNTNLALLRRHQAKLVDGGERTIEVELVGLRLGPMVMLTFPGELTVPIGLGLKERSPHPYTFIAGYTNGYIYYAPTAEQMKNTGGAQEDSDCLLAPEWQRIFETAALEMIRGL